jgi:AcrR family transcriptional regulator
VPPMPRRSAAEAAATREAILAAARAAFSRHGYAAVTLEAIAADAGVTRGAVHHHFADKRALFVEVFNQIEHELNDGIVAAVRAAPPERRLRAGCEALFDGIAQPDFHQVAIADAPGVLGLVAWYEIDRGIGMPTMRSAVQAFADAGLLLDADLVEPLTVLLFGALTEAAVALATGATELRREQLLDAIEHLVAGVAAGMASTPNPA